MADEDDIQAQINAAVAQVATDFGALYVKYIKDALLKKDKLATGALYNSIDSNVYIQDDGVHLELLYLDYLNWIDLGRRAGKMPPVDAILEWVMARRIAGVANARRNSVGRFSRGIRVNKGRNGKGQYTSVRDEAKKIAWAISFGIKKNGIKPFPILQPAKDKIYQPMQDAATEAAAATGAQIVSDAFADQLRSNGIQVLTS